MTEKGRRIMGDTHPCSRLTSNLVIQIRRSKESTRIIAERLGMSYQAIYDARTKRRWRHV
jgi:hypothetical protein